MMLPVEHWTGSLGWKAEMGQNPICQVMTVWKQADDSDLGCEREAAEASSHFGACLLHCSLTERGAKYIHIRRHLLAVLMPKSIT